MQKPQILLTNDDGIHSPGLWAAAAALSELGFVHVVAPRQQVSGAGRSLPNSSDGRIAVQQVTVNGKTWQVYAVGGTPAQCVLYALFDILPQPPALLVSGINYGENTGNGVTISGTVGAALEAASMGIPALAISLQVAVEHHLSNSDQVDFSAAAHFTGYFAQRILEQTSASSAGFPPDVDLLKVEVPADATPLTPWHSTRVSRKRYWIPTPAVRSSWDDPAVLGYALADDLHQDDPHSDSYVLLFDKQVTVSPMSLDLTSRVNLAEFDRLLRQE
jgi:5'-nucleotidase